MMCMVTAANTQMCELSLLLQPLKVRGELEAGLKPATSLRLTPSHLFSECKKKILINKFIIFMYVFLPV